MVTSKSANELAWLIFNSTAPRLSAARTISPAEHRNTNLKRGLSIELPALAKFPSIILGGSLLIRHSQDSRWCGTIFFPSGVLCNGKSRSSRVPNGRTGQLTGAGLVKLAVLPASRRSSAVVGLSHLASRSCRRGRRLQPGDQRQGLGKHLPRHRDLGQLESNRSGRG
jgi:hypothetical protein